MEDELFDYGSFLLNREALLKNIQLNLNSYMEYRDYTPEQKDAFTKAVEHFYSGIKNKTLTTNGFGEFSDSQGVLSDEGEMHREAAWFIDKIAQKQANKTSKPKKKQEILTLLTPYSNAFSFPDYFLSTYNPLNVKDFNYKHLANLPEETKREYILSALKDYKTAFDFNNVDFSNTGFKTSANYVKALDTLISSIENSNEIQESDELMLNILGFGKIYEFMSGTPEPMNKPDDNTVQDEDVIVPTPLDNGQNNSNWEEKVINLGWKKGTNGTWLFPNGNDSGISLNDNPLDKINGMKFSDIYSNMGLSDTDKKYIMALGADVLNLLNPEPISSATIGLGSDAMNLWADIESNKPLWETVLGTGANVGLTALGAATGAADAGKVIKGLSKTAKVILPLVALYGAYGIISNPEQSISAIERVLSGNGTVDDYRTLATVLQLMIGGTKAAINVRANKKAGKVLNGAEYEDALIVSGRVNGKKTKIAFTDEHAKALRELQNDHIKFNAYLRQHFSDDIEVDLNRSIWQKGTDAVRSKFTDKQEVSRPVNAHNSQILTAEGRQHIDSEIGSNPFSYTRQRVKKALDDESLEVTRVKTIPRNVEPIDGHPGFVKDKDTGLVLDSDGKPFTGKLGDVEYDLGIVKPKAEEIKPDDSKPSSASVIEEKDGKYYHNDELANGTFEGVTFKNGEPLKGWKDGTYYENGRPAEGYFNDGKYTLQIRDGKPWDGEYVDDTGIVRRFKDGIEEKAPVIEPEIKPVINSEVQASYDKVRKMLEERSENSVLEALDRLASKPKRTKGEHSSEYKEVLEALQKLGNSKKSAKKALTDFYKKGGILKALKGTVTGTPYKENPVSWSEAVGSKFLENLIKDLKLGNITADQVNNMQKRHYDLRTKYSSSVANPLYSEDVKKYYEDINNIFKYVNDLGIANAESISRYSVNENANTKDTKSKGWVADGYFSGRGLDRMVLGRAEDWGEDPNVLKQRFLNAGYKLKEGDGGYYYLESITPVAGITPIKPPVTTTTDETGDTEGNGTPVTTPPAGTEGNGTTVRVQVPETTGLSVKDPEINKFKTLDYGALISGINYWRALRTNRKQLELANELTPIQYNPLEHKRWVYGDLQSRNAGYELAGRLYNEGNRATTSDAAQLLAKLLEAVNKGNDWIYKGLQADNDMMRKTFELAIQQNKENDTNRYNVASKNMENQAAVTKEKLMAKMARERADYESGTNFLNELKDIYTANQERKQKYRDYYYNQALTSSINKNPGEYIEGWTPEHQALWRKGQLDSAKLTEEELSTYSQLQGLVQQALDRRLAALWGINLGTPSTSDLYRVWNIKTPYGKEGIKLESTRLSDNLVKAIISFLKESNNNYNKAIDRSLKGLYNHIKLQIRK